MAKEDSRIYELEYPTGEPVLYGDMGNRVRIIGLVISGEDFIQACILPNESFDHPDGGMDTDEFVHATVLSQDDWAVLIKCSDDPVYFAGHPMSKVMHRKAERQISSFVQQSVWARDNFQCVYCGAKMGASTMTIDHFWPVEFDGPSTPDNLVTACRSCNKRKGSKHPNEFLARDVYERVRLMLAIVGAKEA